jgi:hypothetical protein
METTENTAPHTSSDVLRTEASPDTQANGASITTGRPAVTRTRRRLTALLLSVLGFAALVLAMPGTADASASTQGFYAECSVATVQVYTPDMGWYPDYGVSWAPVLYVWTNSGWQRNSTGPTQTALGNNIGSMTGDWMQQQVRFSGMARGHYYQVRVTAAWFGKGLTGSGYSNQVLVPHQTAQGNFTFAAYSNSTSSYCYIP